MFGVYKLLFRRLFIRVHQDEEMHRNTLKDKIPFFQSLERVVRRFSSGVPLYIIQVDLDQKLEWYIN